MTTSSVGPADGRPPVPLDSAILFAPVGHLVPVALLAALVLGARRLVLLRSRGLLDQLAERGHSLPNIAHAFERRALGDLEHHPVRVLRER